VSIKKTLQDKLNVSSSEQAVTARSSDVDAFLQQVNESPPVQLNGERGRLIFALDATASRQRTWNQAMSLTTDMFTQTRGLGQLDVQLVFYRGYDECRSSKWLSSADKLILMMRKVSCLAGHTQIHRVLNHSIAECREKQVGKYRCIGKLGRSIQTVGFTHFHFSGGARSERVDGVLANS